MSSVRFCFIPTLREKFWKLPLGFLTLTIPGRKFAHPFSEEATAVRIMNAVHTHAKSHGSNKTPVFSPADTLIDDGNPDTFVANRQNPPAGSGLKQASSEIFNVTSIKSAGYPVVT